MTMKRYWKLITLTTVVVLTIGTLYIQTSLATSHYPDFVIQHQSGDKDEVKTLKIIGDYVIDEASYAHTEISEEGTSYLHNPSSTLFFLWDNYYLSPEIERLQKDYRNFMRGKHEQIDLYFEDQSVLAYVELKSEYLSARNHQWSFSFEIEVLDKKTKNKSKFEIEVPEEEKIDYLNIQGLQMINDEIKIITVNTLHETIGESHNTEMHIYTVDLQTQKVLSDDVIEVTGTEFAANQWINMYTISNEDHTGSSNQIVFTVDVSEETIIDGEYIYELVDSQLIAYDLETKEQIQIDLSQSDEEIYPELLSGETIYFSTEIENHIEIISYDLKNHQIETKQTFDLPNAEGDLFFTLMNDKIYILNQLSKDKIDSLLMIGDALTGEILYEGSLTLAQSSKDQQVNQMHISHLSVEKE